MPEEGTVIMVASDSPLTKAELRAELKHYAAKADLAELETRLIKWMVGLMVGSIAIASSIALAVQRLTE